MPLVFKRRFILSVNVPYVTYVCLCYCSVSAMATKNRNILTIFSKVVFWRSLSTDLGIVYHMTITFYLQVVELNIKAQYLMDPKKKETKGRKKMVRWSADNISLLIELWAEKITDLRGARRNNHVYHEMLLALNKNGLADATIDDIKVRIHNLTSRYRNEKKKIGASGGSPSDWPMYEQVHAILGSHPIHNVENLVQDSFLQNDNTNEEWLELDAEELYSAGHHESSQGNHNELVVESDINPGPSTSSSSSEPVPEITKKRKRNFQDEILKRFDMLDNRISNEEARLNELDELMVAEERRRTDLLEQFVSNSTDIKNAFVKFLNERK